jgi:uncharacterized protein YpmS
MKFFLLNLRHNIYLILITLIIKIDYLHGEKLLSESKSKEEFKFTGQKSDLLFESFEKFEKFKSESLNYKSNSRNQILLKKCMEGAIADKSLCENLNNLSNKYTTKTMYRVEAIVVDKNSNSTKSNAKSEIFNLAIPINTCKHEDCEFCCLSNNRCGTLKQCTNSNYYRKYLNGIFITLVTILTIVFIIKCYQVDSYPDQDRDDKLKAEQLSDMISLYAITRNNRSKFLK